MDYALLCGCRRRTGGSRQSQQVLVRLPAPHERSTPSREELFQAMLTFGLPLYGRSDPGSEFTANVMQRLSLLSYRLCNG